MIPLTVSCYIIVDSQTSFTQWTTDSHYVKESVLEILERLESVILERSELESDIFYLQLRNPGINLHLSTDLIGKGRTQ